MKMYHYEKKNGRSGQDGQDKKAMVSTYHVQSDSDFLKKVDFGYLSCPILSTWCLPLETVWTP